MTESALDRLDRKLDENFALVILKATELRADQHRLLLDLRWGGLMLAAVIIGGAFAMAKGY